MLSFKDLNEKKKTAVKINPNLKDVMEKKGEKNCGCGQDPCITYGDDRHKKDKVDKVDEAKKKDDTYLETDFKKRLKNNEKARKDLMKGPQMKNPHFESNSYDSQEEISEKSTEESTENSILTFNNFQEATRLKKEKGYDKGGTKKPSGKPTAMSVVLDKIRKEHGHGAVVGQGGSRQSKKVKGSKSDAGTGKYKKAADQKKQTSSDAKKRGFKDVKSYTNTMARYGGKDNYDKGRGLGS